MCSADPRVPQSSQIRGVSPGCSDDQVHQELMVEPPVTVELSLCSAAVRVSLVTCHWPASPENALSSKKKMRFATLVSSKVCRNGNRKFVTRQMCLWQASHAAASRARNRSSVLKKYKQRASLLATIPWRNREHHVGAVRVHGREGVGRKKLDSEEQQSSSNGCWVSW